MGSRAVPAREARIGYRAGPAQITGLRAVPGPRPRHVGRPGPSRINIQANWAGPNRAGPS